MELNLGVFFNSTFMLREEMGVKGCRLSHKDENLEQRLALS